jgi:hypothetical protein
MTMKILIRQLRLIIREEFARLTEAGRIPQAPKRHQTTLPRVASMDEFRRAFPRAFRAIKREFESYGEGPLVDEAGAPAFAISADGTKGYWSGGGDVYVVDDATTDIGKFETDEQIDAHMTAAFESKF